MRLTLAALLLIASAFAADAPQERVKQSDDVASYKKTVRSPIRAAITFTNWESYNNVTIPANSYIYLDSGTNFASAISVQITTRSANGDIGNLAIASSWSVPGAASYNVGSVELGSNFYFNNTGGASFPVAGTQLRTFLYNNGPTTMTLSQVIVYAISQ